MIFKKFQFQWQWKSNLQLCCMVLSLLLASSCTPKTGGKTTATEPAPVHQEEIEITEKTDKFPPTDVELVEPEEIVLPPHLTLRLEKTSCFGHCPTFEIKLFSDGRAQWNGKHHSNRMGLYETHVEEAFLQNILTKALQINYFSLSDHYPINGKYLSDLPNTITYLNDSDLEKSILRNHNGPNSLRKFEDFIIENFDRLSWQKLASE